MHEQRAKLIAAVAGGSSYRSVARRFDVSLATARRWYLEAVPDDPATVATALACLDEGWTVRDVAAGAGVKTWVVRRWARAATLG